MKKNIRLSLLFLSLAFTSNSQTILYAETFVSSLTTCSATGGTNGNWVWSGSCAQSTAAGHTTPGHAMFQGSGCQFGNGSSTTSGNLITPTVALGALGATLTFNYFIENECSAFSSDCGYDILSVGISTNGGLSYTDVLNSDTSPGGLASNNTTWTAVSFNLSSYLNQTITIRFNFDSGDGVLNNYDGIYVDDIHVIGACSINAFATNGSITVAPILCSGTSLTLSTNAVSNYSWSNGATTPSIVVSPTVTTQYSLAATSSLTCNSNAVITVTVSGGLPVLAVNASTNNVCLGKTVTLTATGANSYTWTGGVSNGVGFVPTSSSAYTVTGANGCGTATSVTNITVAPLPVSIIVTPTQVCSGDIAVISVAAAATSFSWFPLNTVVSSASIAVSPQVNTTYTVAAGDGTCSGVATISLATVPVPTISVVLSNTLVCQGDPVVISASGGLNYTWTPGNLSGATVTVNPTAPVSYSVGADNSFGCYAGTTAVIITNPTPTLTLNSSSNLICSGETVSLSVSGASSYLWTNNSTATNITDAPTVSTIYGVTGTDNGCSSTQTVQVGVFTPVVSVSGATAICLGNSTTLTASGANNYTWNPGSVPIQAITVSPTVNTVYTISTITSTDNILCAGIHTLEVVINPNPNVLATPDRTLMCKNETATITASGANSYVWSLGGNTPSVIVTSSLVTVLNYSVTGTGANGCKTTKVVNITVSGCNSISELSEGNFALNVFPNPNAGDFTIQAKSALNFEIVNELGQLIRKVELTGKENYSVNLTGISAGVYFIKVKGEAAYPAFKVIVQN